MYMTVKQAAEKWGISGRHVRILCAEGKGSGQQHLLFQINSIANR